jgi:drug/metabolite transporter (DMT)-like permease
MAGSIAAFTAMAIAGRAVQNVHDTFEIMTWRSLIGFGIVVGVARLVGRLSEVRRDRLPAHALRNIIHFAGQNLWFHALAVIPLAQVFALEFTTPLWVILLSALILGERLTGAKALAGGLGLLGVYLVAAPDFTVLNLGVVAALLAAVSFATTSVLTKALTQHETIVSILFWLTLMQLGLGVLAAGWDGDLAPPTAATLPWLALIGFCGVCAHLCLTTALSLAPAGIVAPMDFARLPLIALIGWVWYDEAIAPGLGLGAGLIVLGILINLRAGRRAAVQQATDHKPVTPRQ